MQRIDELTGPPEIGVTYLVPTVYWQWFSGTRNWPVIGPKHNDAQCLDFHAQHHHLDARFIPFDGDYYYWRSVMASPLQTNATLNKGGLPEPVWRPRRCRRLENPVNASLLVDIGKSAAKTWRCHFDQWVGKQARRDARGWVCPHRSVPLADQPVTDGVITCPLHLLRIDAATGVVLPGPHGKAVAP